MLCWHFGDHCHVWLCYYGPLVTLAVLGYVMKAHDLNRVWLCYVGPFVTLTVFGYVM